MRRPSVVVDGMLRATTPTLNERPFPMRWRKADLRRRVNGSLALRFQRTGLTSYAGFEFVRRYLGGLGLVAVLRRELGAALPPTDFGVPTLVLVTLALLI